MQPSPEEDRLDVWGWNDRWAALASEHPGRPARVTRVDATVVTAESGDGTERIDAMGLTVGDWVIIEDGAVVDTLHRTSELTRKRPGRDEPQVVAANVDRVLVVSGLDRPVKSGRLHRAATQAWETGAQPTIILSKTDLLDAGELRRIRDTVEADLVGVDVHACSTVTGEGVEAVRTAIDGSTAVLVGESGSGKSTLLNALTGADERTSAVREGDRKGRHTTSWSQLLALGGGTCVVDTPGFRELGLWADGDAVDAGFPDIVELEASCRFRDCRHGPEPGCAVRAAVDSGELAAERLAQYDKLTREIERTDRSRHEQHEVDRAQGKLYRSVQNRQRPDSH